MGKTGCRTLLAWNIRQGGGGRASRIANAIEKHRPDIVVLTEFRGNGPGDQITSALRSFGLNCTYATATSKGNGVLIAANREFEAETFRRLGADSHRCLRAGFGVLDVFGLYFGQRRTKRPLFEFLLNLPGPAMNRPTLLVGDFNTGVHQEDEVGRTFFCATEFSALLTSGWVDAWRAEHGSRREYTWFSRSGNGFRVDHMLASPPIAARLSSVRYSHEERMTGLSDHSLMVAEICSAKP